MKMSGYCWRMSMNGCSTDSMSRGSIGTKRRHSIEISNRRSVVRKGWRPTAMPGRWHVPLTKGSTTGQNPKSLAGVR
jgi:hypothetical protein